MRLSELHPAWFAEPGRFGQGIVFDCPCCLTKPIEQRSRLAVAFSNPIDCGAPFPITNQKVLWGVLVWNIGNRAHPPIVPPGVHWKRIGVTFEDLTVEPSVDASGAHHWHGFVEQGRIRP